MSICWIGWNALSSLGGPLGVQLLTVFAFPCPRIPESLGTGLGIPLMESFDPWFPEGVMIQTKDFDHASALICMMDKTLAFLLWTDHILIIPLVLWKDEDLAVFPWSWYRWKTIWLGKNLIELFDHLIHIFELGVLRQLDRP